MHHTWYHSSSHAGHLIFNKAPLLHNNPALLPNKGGLLRNKGRVLCDTRPLSVKYDLLVSAFLVLSVLDTMYHMVTAGKITEISFCCLPCNANL